MQWWKTLNRCISKEGHAAGLQDQSQPGVDARATLAMPQSMVSKYEELAADLGVRRSNRSGCPHGIKAPTYWGAHRHWDLCQT